MSNPTYTEARMKLSEELDRSGITIASKFVPLSKSRNAGEDHPTVNYSVRVFLAGRLILETPYTMGNGWINLPQGLRAESVDGSGAIKRVCELGKSINPRAEAPVPIREDVLSSLIQDSAGVLDSSFEDWAEELGYDPDSREAEHTYNKIKEQAFQFLRTLGTERFHELAEIARDL